MKFTIKDAYKAVMALQAQASIHHTQIMEAFRMSQSQVDALTQQVATMSTNLQTADAAIRAEIAALQNANPALDLTSLQAAVDSLGVVATDVGSIAPAP